MEKCEIIWLDLMGCIIDIWSIHLTYPSDHPSIPPITFGSYCTVHYYVRCCIRCAQYDTTKITLYTVQVIMYVHNDIPQSNGKLNVCELVSGCYFIVSLLHCSKALCCGRVYCMLGGLKNALSIGLDV